MPFLVDADYKDQIKDSVLSTIIDADASLRTNCEQKAQAQITSRLGVRYNMTAAFALTGAARNPEIIMYYIDMVLYHLHSRINPGQVPEVRKERYGDALTWLDKVASGDYVCDLPKVGDADEDGVDDREVIQHGSRTARNPYF